MFLFFVSVAEFKLLVVSDLIRVFGFAMEAELAVLSIWQGRHWWRDRPPGTQLSAKRTPPHLWLTRAVIGDATRFFLVLDYSSC